MAITLVSLAFLLGIYLASVAGLTPPLVFITLALLACLPLVKRNRAVAILTFCLIAGAAGAIRLEFARPYDAASALASKLASFNETGATVIRGMVDQEPEVSGRTLRLYIKTTEKSNGRQWQAVSGNVLVFLPEYADYRYGDVLELNGELETPVTFEDFDYRAYLADRQIYTTMLYPKVTVIERDKGLRALAALYAFKNNLGAALSASLPEPQAALARGILLGIRGGIPAPLKDDFAASGTTHVLAISGANLSIIAGMLLGLFTLIFGKQHGLHIALTLAVIWGYAVLSGLEPPVVRSAIMASVFLAAELLGRQKNALPGLALSGAVMTLVDPRLLWDVSFQLSFMAMAGLIIVYPPLEVVGRRLALRLFGDKGLISGIAGRVGDNLGMSLAATIAIFPLNVNYFGALSLVGIPATVLVLPVLPLIIFTTALTAFIGLVSLPIAAVGGYLAWIPLSWFLIVSRTAAAIPGALIPLPSLNPLIIIAYYGLLGLVLHLTRKWIDQLKAGAPGVNNGLFNHPLKWFLIPAGLVIIGIILAIRSSPDGQLHVSFLDVGQGDAILIQRGSCQILVDGGPDAQTTLNALGQKLPFWDRDIELVVLTHPDADHITGLIEVIKRYNVRQALYPEIVSNSLAGRAWLAALKEKGVEQYHPAPGQRLDFASVKVEVVLPARPPAGAGEDSRGVALRVSEGKIGFLLTADMTAATERELILEGAALDCTVLKVAHHGSANGTSAAFLAVSDPDFAVIPVGKDNRFGHPAPEVRARLEDAVGKENVFRTDINGSLEFITDGERLWLVRER